MTRGRGVFAMASQSIVAGSSCPEAATRRLARKSWGLDFGNPDFVKYAESYGAHGHRITATEELVPRLRECLQTPGVHLIDVPVDYSQNDRVLNQEIKEMSAQV